MCGKYQETLGYRGAAERGLLGAQAVLGIMCDSGVTVPLDDVQAHL